MEKNRTGRIAINQPFFLPYIGYIKLLWEVETFVSLDQVQYSSGSWGNRNRLPSTSERGWSYFGCPIRRGHLSSTYAEIRIDNSSCWKRKILNTLTQNYQKSPFFDDVICFLEPLWSKTDRLCTLNESLIEAFMSYIGYMPKLIRCSSLEHKFTPIKNSTGAKRVIETCHALRVRKYYNLPGGRNLYSKNEFLSQGIDLAFVPNLNLERIWQKYPRIRAYSIVDVLMNHSPSETIEILALMDS